MMRTDGITTIACSPNFLATPVTDQDRVRSLDTPVNRLTDVVQKACTFCEIGIKTKLCCHQGCQVRDFQAMRKQILSITRTFLRQNGALGRRPRASRRPAAARQGAVGAVGAAIERPEPPATSCASARRPSCASTTRSAEGLDFAADGRGAGPVGAAIDEADDGDELDMRSGLPAAARRARPKASTSRRTAAARALSARRSTRPAGRDELDMRPAAFLRQNGALGRRPRPRGGPPRRGPCRRGDRRGRPAVTSWTCARRPSCARTARSAEGLEPRGGRPRRARALSARSARRSRGRSRRRRAAPAPGGLPAPARRARPKASTSRRTAAARVLSARRSTRPAAGDELRQRPAAFLRQRGAFGRRPRPRGGRPWRARALRRSMRPKPPATSCASARRPSCASAARSAEGLDLAADGRGAPGRCGDR